MFSYARKVMWLNRHTTRIIATRTKNKNTAPTTKPHAKHLKSLLVISIKAWKSESGVIISVTDSGKGIADHEMTKIWDRLYRGEENRDGSDKGLGLGLAQVKAILRAHNGWVKVSSKPDMGSTFRVHLPQ